MTAHAAAPDPRGLAGDLGFAAQPDGAAAYLVVRPARLASLLRRAGAEDSDVVKSIRAQAGVDPLDPATWASSGLDTDGPATASLFEPVAGGAWYRHRVVVAVASRTRFGLVLTALSLAKDLHLELAADGTQLYAAGVRAWVRAPGAVAILRLDGDRAIVDVATAGRSAPPGPDALAARLAIDLAGRSFADAATHGARAWLAERADPAAAVLGVYVDGRRLPSLARPLATLEKAVADAVPAGDDPARKKELVDEAALALREAPSCAAAWGRAAATYDDLALVASDGDDGVSLAAAWGAAKHARVRLDLAGVDDGAVDLDTVGRFAAFAVGLRVVSLAPFAAVRATPPFRSAGELGDLVGRCRTLGVAAVAVRHWPQALALAVRGLASVGSASLFGPAVEAAGGRLRNLSLLVRDADGGQVRWALVATLDGAAKELLDTFLMAAGTPEFPRYGARRPAVYAFESELWDGVVAVETLPSGRLALVLADSRATVDWVYASPAHASDKAPVLAAFVDGNKLRKLDPSLPVEVKVGAAATAVGLAEHARKLELHVVPDGDTLEMELRATLPPPPKAAAR